jgi:hypothetical protein
MAAAEPIAAAPPESVLDDAEPAEQAASVSATAAPMAATPATMRHPGLE